jgi:23S rRNA pseudouridine1911/1915/1917 synthase
VRRPAPDELPVVYEDAALLVVDKPAGLLTVKLDARADAPTLVDGVRRHLRSRGKREPLVVHRIDRDTSGLVVFAKTAAAHADLVAQFERREPERVYWAVVHGVPDPAEGTWEDSLVWDPDGLSQRVAAGDDERAKAAISHYRVLETFGAAAALVEVRLVTGKRNQIRVQAARRGHPLVGERQYLGTQPPAVVIPFGRQALHAGALTLVHPVSGQRLHVEADPPPDFRKLLRALRRETQSA